SQSEEEYAEKLSGKIQRRWLTAYVAAAAAESDKVTAVVPAAVMPAAPPLSVTFNAVKPVYPEKSAVAVPPDDT
ncbi:hypothetical protein, partial [Ferrovum myxofaciens]